MAISNYPESAITAGSATIGSVGMVDMRTGSRAHVSAYGHLKTAETMRLIGGTFEGSAISTTRWVTTTANGGTATAPGTGVVTMATNSTANGSVVINSVRLARMLAGSPNVFAAQVRLTTAPAANHLNRIGISSGGGATPTDGVFIELTSTPRIIIRKGGTNIETITTFNGVAPTIDTSNHRYEIMYEGAGLTFYQDGVLLHTYAAAAQLWANTMHLKIHMESTNSSSATFNGGMEIRAASISRFGQATARGSYYHAIDTTTNIGTGIVIKSSPGNLENVMVNKKSGGTNTTLALHDAATTGAISAANMIANLDLINLQGPMDYDIDFDNGLVIVSSGAGTGWDITINYD